ncbi:MAG: manganese efflux pump [Clostridia bacterium]|nr:manganese efflux pump [Clostridia bacterium]
MGIIEILILGLGLAMDAFAVAICKGLALEKTSLKHYVTVGIWFGGFQGLMPLIGYFLGKVFGKYIESIDHWVAFGLLVLIGGNMIKESFEICCDCEKKDAGLGFMTMLILAVSTSIDAAATGIVLESEGANIWLSVIIITTVTFVISAAGVKIGNVFGSKYKNKAEFAGGIILILLGTKMLLEGLNILNV